MSRHHRIQIFIVSIVLMILFVVGPPAAMASRLPTICNIFSQDTAEKTRAGGHRAVIAKIQDKYFEAISVLLPGFRFETIHLLIVPNNPTSFSPLFGSSSSINPLRC